MIEAGPDMPNPSSKIFQKLASERNRVAFELPSVVIRAENRRMRQALLLQAKQAAVLWIQLEKSRYLMVKTCGTAGQSASNRSTA